MMTPLVWSPKIFSNPCFAACFEYSCDIDNDKLLNTIVVSHFQDGVLVTPCKHSVNLWDGIREHACN